ncbi:flagellar M-ring protein FliF [Chelatococcus daeguensis]|uniref:Flagellar M-ring protein n=1 Tax=Chelatococcus daeguensis TaxID=444444 RepID=A0AAC9JQS3_9HYPH|nr:MULTISPECIES: flagellar basal-body MS-ring/collar protein FliF [Chelatococcus]APF38478.1 flagellar M-ring protein FliF [Chelatococcus daeguensis]KZE34231.1 flagellar M-ring protein FliF [Chelatococcus daeguensis]MBM3083181.1 flagellar M-ring protein FliF [Chelatococcus daeguensis]
MTSRAQAEQLWANIRDLGTRRLIALGFIGLAVFLVVGLGAYYLSRPQQEPLYTGLTREDVSRMGAVLKDAGIPFDVSADGTSVLVNYGNTARARMLLAEKGLPQSANSGYELFNDLGSLGLTSFMQEVTRVRALEGELARTIQTMSGIKAARVHIVLPDRGSFRREEQPASASVVIRTETADSVTPARAIRHLVAAAIPGMSIDKVTVLNTDGTLVLAGDDAASAATGRMANLERTVSLEIQDNIRKTLVPYLGLSNFEVSVAARLNTDRTRTNETIYDPESRVERSIRTIRETEVSQNSNNQNPTTVQQNLPNEQVQANGGEVSSEDNQRREEVTNYEISSKTVETVRDGYRVERLSIAVLVNRERLASLAGEGATDAAIAQQIREIEQLVASAAGAITDRGDQVKVSSVSFVADSRNLEPVPPIGIGELLVRQSGNFINAATILVVALLVIWFGLKPAVAAILARPPAEETQVAAATGEPALPPGTEVPQIAGPAEGANLIEELTIRMNQSPQRRLEQMVEFSEEQAAAILKQWLYQEDAA